MAVSVKHSIQNIVSFGIPQCLRNIGFNIGRSDPHMMVTNVRYNKKNLILGINKLNQPVGWTLAESLNSKFGL